MDNYEKLLTEKIEIAKCSLVCVDDTWERSDHSQEREELTGEIKAYQDALNLYKNLKAKGEI